MGGRTIFVLLPPGLLSPLVRALEEGSADADLCGRASKGRRCSILFRHLSSGLVRVAACIPWELCAPPASLAAELFATLAEVAEGVMNCDMLLSDCDIVLESESC